MAASDNVNPSQFRDHWSPTKPSFLYPDKKIPFRQQRAVLSMPGDNEETGYRVFGSSTVHPVRNKYRVEHERRSYTPMDDAGRVGETVERFKGTFRTEERAKIAGEAMGRRPSEDLGNYAVKKIQRSYQKGL